TLEPDARRIRPAIGVVEARCAAIEDGVVEVPLRQSNSPAERFPTTRQSLVVCTQVAGSVLSPGTWLCHVRAKAQRRFEKNSVSATPPARSPPRSCRPRTALP